jgi:hypothetical protein
LRSIVNFKGTPEYAAWCKRFAESLGDPQVKVIEEAMRRYAKAKSYDPPPSRTGRAWYWTPVNVFSPRPGRECIHDPRTDHQRRTDRGGSGVLRAARTAAILTGGWAAASWLTENRPAPWLAEDGLVECPEPGDPARRNVAACYAALLFGGRTSPGSKGLIRDCRELGKLLVWVQKKLSRPSHITAFLRDNPHVKVHLVAGNRESSAPGIRARVERFLGTVFAISRGLMGCT